MADDSAPDDKKDPQPEFKKPVLIGRIGKLPKKAKSNTEKAAEAPSLEKPKEIQINIQTAPKESGSKSSLPPAVLLKELSTPIPYKEPKWSGICPDGSGYALEVLKSGCILERIDLTTKPYYVFGRLANCDVVMAHPTISRHHAVLQYRTSSDGEAPGWYMYELGSTHGTFLNRASVKAAHYTRVRVGHQIKFGNSTRTYVMLGPDFDCEGESDLTVTEIKQRAEVMRAERDRMIQEAKEQRERSRLEEEKKREEQGIDWGMGEDAEEEPDLADNPFAVTTNEELYLDDPKKTLRGYFEREGHELTYDCEERGHGQYICRVELPMDDARGRPVVAEAIHTGKKKEAVVACALEACRVLDRAGLLRQAKHESRRRKSRDWSADDYYDSDDDTFLDRTGHIERKRKQRMIKHGAEANAQDRPLSLDDLLKQIEDLQSKIAAEEQCLDRLRATKKASEQTDEADDLDAYMDSLSNAGQSMAVKAEISKTKMSIQKLKAELSKTSRLAEIARPASLPPLIKQGSNKMAVKTNNSVVYGKRIKLKNDEKRPKPKPAETKQEEEFVEEVDSDEETEPRIEEKHSTKEESHKDIKSETKYQKDEEISYLDHKTDRQDEKTFTSENTNPQTSKIKDKNGSGKSEIEDAEHTRSSEVESPEHKKSTSKTEESKIVKKKETENKKVYGPMRPPENYVIPDDYFNQESDRDLPEIMEEE